MYLYYRCADAQSAGPVAALKPCFPRAPRRPWISVSLSAPTVRGLWPWRAGASAVEANTAPTAASAAGFPTPASQATRSTMSRLFIPSLRCVAPSGGRAPAHQRAVNWNPMPYSGGVVVGRLAPARLVGELERTGAGRAGELPAQPVATLWVGGAEPGIGCSGEPLAPERQDAADLGVEPHGSFCLGVVSHIIS